MLTSLSAFWNKYKYQTVMALAAIISYIVIFLYIKDLQQQNKALSEKASTLSEQFMRVGDAYQAQGKAFATDKEAWEALKAAQGKKLADVMAEDQAKLRALFEANGRLEAELKNIQPVTVLPTAENGAFSNAFLMQVRTGPALTSLILSYDPSNKDAKQRLTGVWNNNREDFKPTVAEWEKKDKGLVATIRLTRTVYDASGKVVGVEDIPLTNATATFGPIAFGGEQALDPVPRFTIFGGIGKDTAQNNRVVTVLGVDYRFTTRVGVGAGVVGNTYFGSISYRFGK